MNLFRSFGIGKWVEGDIVHAHGFPANIFIAFIRKFGLLKGKKLIFTSHSEKKSEKEIVRKFYIFFLKEFDKITCVGEKSYKSMIREFPELEDKIVQINNGIKVDSFYYKDKDEKLKKDLEAFYFKIYLDRLQEFNFSLFDKIKYSFQYLNPKFIGWKIFFKYLNFIFFRLK